MKQIIALLLITTQSYAGLPPTSIQGQSDASPKTKFNFQAPNNQITDLGGIKALIETGNSNILPDPGFEAATSGWTASGGATAAANATAKGTGAKGYDWDSNSAGQTLTSSSVTIPAGLQGKNGILSCQIKTVSGTATHTIGLWDGSTLSSTQTITSSTTSFSETKINFVFPASGTAAIRLTSVNANEPELYIDDCKISLADNIGTVAQAILVDAMTVTGCAGYWTTTSATFATLGTQTGCTYTSSKGVATAPATNIPAFKFASLPAGDYKIEYEGFVKVSNTSDFGFFQFSDGTNTARETSSFSGSNGVATISQSISYSAPQSNVTLDLRAKTGSGLTASISGITGQQGVFKLWYFPSSSQQAVSSAQADYDWTAYTPTLGAGVGTPTNISFLHRRVDGDIEIKGTFNVGTPAASLVSITLPNSLTIDSTRMPLSNTTANPGPSVGQWSGGTGSGHFGSIVTALGTSNSLVYLGNNITNTVLLTPVNGSSALSTSEVMTVNFKFPVTGWSSNQRAPTLIGSVTNNSTANTRIDTISFCYGGSATCSGNCTGGTCNTSSSSSSLTSVTYNSTGNYTANFTKNLFKIILYWECWLLRLI